MMRNLRAGMLTVTLAGATLALGGCSMQSYSCKQKNGAGECTITTTSSGKTVDMPFSMDQDGGRDRYRFTGVNNGEASFEIAGQSYSCRQGETVEVSEGKVDCLEVDSSKKKLKVKVYVGDAQTQ